jgi:hypothetical protein
VLAVLGVVIVGAFVVLNSSAPNEFSLNGFDFVMSPCDRGQCYETTVYTNVGVHPITFYSDPREVGDVPVDSQAVSAILNLTRSRNSSVTIGFDEGVPGEVGVAAALIARVTGERLYNISTSGAVYGQDVICEMSTATDRVIYLTQTPRDGVFYQDGCVIVSASDVDSLIPVVDAYVMRLLLIL